MLIWWSNYLEYRGFHRQGFRCDGDVVLDSFNMAFRKENDILYQTYMQSKYVRIINRNILMKKRHLMGTLNPIYFILRLEFYSYVCKYTFPYIMYFAKRKPSYCKFECWHSYLWFKMFSSLDAIVTPSKLTLQSPI